MFVSVHHSADHTDDAFDGISEQLARHLSVGWEIPVARWGLAVLGGGSCEALGRSVTGRVHFCLHSPTWRA